MTDQARDAAAVIGGLAASPGVTLHQARVTAVHTGTSPKTVDLLIEDRWAIASVPYLTSYASPSANDAVYVLAYGPGRRLVIGEQA
jgi:hypothetical protein